MARFVDAWPRLMRPDIVEGYVGGRTNLERLFEFGLKPSRQTKCNTIYLRDEVDKAITEAHLAEWNSADPKPKSKSK